MSGRYQVVDTATGHKLNVIVWSGIGFAPISSGQRIEPDDGLPVWVPEPDPHTLPDLTDRQFARGLRDEGIITFDECRAFVGPGTIPPALQTILDLIPDQTARENAIIDVTGAQRFEFANPLVEFVRGALAQQDPKWTPAFLRERWMAWSGV